MLLSDDEYKTDLNDFNEINNDFSKIGSLSIPKQENNPKNDQKLTLGRRIALFLVGFSYCGFLVINFLVVLIVNSFTEDETLLILLTNAFTYVILFSILFYIAFKAKGFLSKELKNYNNYIKGLYFGIIAIVTEIFLSLILNNLIPTEVNKNQQTVTELFTFYPTIMFFIAVFIGPFCEELTYRVGLYGLIREKNKYLAFFLSALIFAFIHMGFTDTTFAAEATAFVVYFAIGLVLNYAYEKNGLAASFTAHLFVNLISFLATFLV